MRFSDGFEGYGALEERFRQVSDGGVIVVETKGFFGAGPQGVDWSSEGYGAPEIVGFVAEGEELARYALVFRGQHTTETLVSQPLYSDAFAAIAEGVIWMLNELNGSNPRDSDLETLEG